MVILHSIGHSGHNPLIAISLESILIMEISPTTWGYHGIEEWIIHPFPL